MFTVGAAWNADLKIDLLRLGLKNSTTVEPEYSRQVSAYLLGS